MNIRQAILAAAQQIEGSPWLFRFSQIQVPATCGTPGCALGWIGFYYGAKRIKSVIEDPLAGDVARLLGVGAETFYTRMSSISAERRSGDSWISNAELCAQSLRTYADRYHPETNFARDIVAKVSSMAVIAEGVE